MRAPHAFIAGSVVALALGCAAATPAAAFTLSNTSNGDGYVQNVTSSSFDLFGANNGVGSNTTFYTQTALKDLTLLFNYTYTTHDSDGSSFDPAGYTIGGVSKQLSANGLGSGLSNSGSAALKVAAGESYGFYVHSTDSIFGRGELAVSYSTALSSVPLPASAPMFGAALLALGAVGYGVNRKKAAA